MPGTDVSLRERLRALPEPAWNDWLDDAAYDFEPDDVAALIALVTDPELLAAGEDDPDRWLSVHAWRALGVMGSEAAVEPLLGALEEWSGDDWILMDLPRVLARIGAGALPALRELGMDAGRTEFARMSAVEALERIGLLHPRHRDACVDVLSAMLRGFERESPELNAMVIGSLAELAATEAAPLMEAAFRAERVDLTYNGDWEDVQIELGLLEERLTPRPRLRPDWAPPELVHGPPLPGWRNLDQEGTDALRRVFEAPDASGPVRSLRALEGFLFTIASVPEVVPPSDWIEFLLDDAPIGNTEAEVNTALRALIALYNGIQKGVNGERFGPPEDLFREDVMANLEPDAEASQWCRGFALGHSWLEELWSVEEEEDKELGALLFTLSFFASRKVAEDYARTFSERERPVEEITSTVRSIWPDALVEYATMGREIGRRETAARRRRPVRASVEERTGRNDPCPCGSGRKFKKCCGRQVH